MSTAAQTKPGFQVWMLAARPRTLFAAFVPVVVGTSLAFAEGKFHPLAAFVALAVSVLIQIGTNFTNDLYDFLKGADTSERVGPLRVLASGLVTPGEMKLAISLCFGTAFLLGLYLVYLGGWFILLLGIFSILAGLAYTAGPYPLAYNGLGDLFVFLFYGLIGTLGSYFVQTLSFSTLAIIASVPVGALVTNILVVNNYRDIEQDKKAGKHTLAVKLGEAFSRYEYVILLTASFAVPLILFLAYPVSPWVFLPYLTLPFGYKLVLMVFTLHGTQLNKALELTAKFSALFGLLLSLGFVL